MPARTNPFQQLVKILHDRLDSSAEVTESAMLTDRLTGQPVEVDIVVRHEVSGYPVVVSIECRDHKRRQGPGWLDEMVGKHRYLETSRLVLVSSSGFTATAQSISMQICFEEHRLCVRLRHDIKRRILPPLGPHALDGVFDNSVSEVCNPFIEELTFPHIRAERGLSHGLPNVLANVGEIIQHKLNVRSGAWITVTGTEDLPLNTQQLAN